LSKNQRETVDIIRNSGKNLLNLINDILDFSKIESGKFNIEKLDFSLSKMLQEVESMMKIKADKKSIDFMVIKKGNLPSYLQTDPDRLKQCLINLINNAIKFTEKGYVHLNVSSCYKDNIPYIRFEVEDTGIGIPKQKQKLIFEAFSQADGSTTRQFGGTGLGLTITRQLTELMGGNISLTSRENKGSTFSITIPVGLTEAEQTRIEQQENDSKQKDENNNFEEFAQQINGGKVLVAEDVKTNQILIKSILKKIGFDVTIVGDGKQAVEKAESGKFDLILLDIQMPVMDGLQAAEHLRKENIDTPIIALTAHSMKGDDKKCIDAGCNDYLSKPIDRTLLKKKLAKYFNDRPCIA
jgi:hypothetical protein